MVKMLEKWSSHFSFYQSQAYFIVEFFHSLPNHFQRSNIETILIKILLLTIFEFYVKSF